MSRPTTLLLTMLATLLVAAPADAHTVLLGSPLSAGATLEQQCAGTGCTLMQDTLPGATLAAPEAGTITSWTARGNGSALLRVLRPVAGGGYKGVATSITATLTPGAGTTSPVSIPVEKGDRIGIDLLGQNSSILGASTPGATYAYWIPALADGSSLPSQENSDQTELLLNATLEVPDPPAAEPAPAAAQSAPAASKPAAARCTVPKLVGHSVRAARRALARHASCRLALKVRGSSSGRVRSQSPRAGRRVAAGTAVTVATRRR